MKKLSFIGAHCDDAEIWAGGTMLKHRDQGEEVSIFLPADAEREMQHLEEQRASCEKGGFTYFLYETRKDLIEKLTAIAPDILITHWDDDTHRDHRRVSQDVIEAAQRCMLTTEKPTEMYFCTTYNGLGLHGEFSPDHYVNIEPYIDRKNELIRFFQGKSPEHWIRYATVLHELYGFRCRYKQAEGFKRFGLLGYYGAGSTL